MLRLFIFLCAFLVVGAGLYHFMLQGAGYLLIVWGKTSIEMSLWVAITLILLLFLVLYIIIKVYKTGVNSVVSTKRFLFGRSNKKAHTQMIAGLTDFIEGNWQGARKKLESSASKVDSPLINYLAAARSAYELGDEKQALSLLHKAEETTDQPSLAVALTQAKMQIANEHYEQALATLERASSISAKHPAILDLKRQAYSELQDWESLKKLLPVLTQNKIGSVKERHELTIHVYKQLLLSNITPDNTQTTRLDALKTFWKETPNDIKQDEHLLALYVREIMALGDDDRAERILSDGLNNHWYEHWIHLYGLLQCSDDKIALATAEKWTKKHNSAGLYLTLGRLCARKEQWGRAVDYFNQSLSIKATGETYAELASVQEQLGQTEESQKNYKQGLLLFVQSR